MGKNYRYFNNNNKNNNKNNNNNNSNNNDRNNYHHHQQHNQQDRQRSRKGNNRWVHSSNKKYSRKSQQNKNYFYKNNNKDYHHGYDDAGDKKIFNQINIDNSVKLQKIKQFLISSKIGQSTSSSPSYAKKNFINFSVNIIKCDKPPEKQKIDKLNELKDRITPVCDIWRSTIRQYLNDTEFVEICRKNNSVVGVGDIHYGKSIIRYDRQQQSKNVQYNSKENFQYPVFSRAYFKLWEILNLGILDKKKQEQIIIANLAQGPGGFIHSLVDFRLKQNKTIRDQYFAITLLIEQGKTRHANDWSDTRAKQLFYKLRQQQKYRIKLSYGQTEDGDLLKLQNIESFKNHIMQGKLAYLVTGDGGIECLSDDQYHYQEIFNAKLFFAQILTAFKIQQLGGVFVLKIYDLYFEASKQLVILLCIFYKSVKVIKPLTSRPGNSEKYLLCQGFQGASAQQISQLETLLAEWTKTQQKLSYFENTKFISEIFTFSGNKEAETQIRDRIAKMNKQLICEQQEAIQKGLNLIEEHKGDQTQIKAYIKENRQKYQLSYAYQWCKAYNIPTQKVIIQHQPIVIKHSNNI